MERNPAVERSFWVACVLAVIGAVGPLVVGLGQSNRIAGVIVPFGVAAVVMAVIALTYRRGRGYSALLYFVGGLAITYGFLFVLTVPLRLAVQGTCTTALSGCTAGLEPPLSGAEANAMSVALAMGVLTLLAGFFGLLLMYRRAPRRKEKSVWPAHPPTPAAEAATSKAEAQVEAKPEAKPEPAPDEAAPMAELPAPEEHGELPPHEEPPPAESPPH